MEQIAEFKIEKGTELIPTVLRIRFNPKNWYFGFHQSRMQGLSMTEEEIQNMEVGQAISKFTYYLEHEMVRAAEEQLRIKIH